MKLTKEYMAGFFDGEGCVNMVRTHTNCYPRILIVNTNLEVLEAFKDYYGGDITKGSNHRINHKWKPTWTWRLSHTRAVMFLRDLYPWLIVKEQQALTAMCWDEARPGRGGKWDQGSIDLFHERMAWLNRKGPDLGDEDPAVRVAREMHIELMKETSNASQNPTH